MVDRLTFSGTKDVALFILYEYTARDHAVSCTIKEMKRVLGDSASLNFLRSAMQENYQMEQVYFSKGAADDTEWMLTGNGIEYAESILKSKKDIYRFVVKKIDGELTGSDSIEKISSEKWEPLPLERSGPEYDAAIEISEKALKEISGNNGYAESAPEERDRIVWSVSEGIKNIRPVSQ